MASADSLYSIVDQIRRITLRLEALAMENTRRVARSLDHIEDSFAQLAKSDGQPGPKPVRKNGSFLLRPTVSGEAE
jgi:hypothetical protein